MALLGHLEIRVIRVPEAMLDQQGIEVSQDLKERPETEDRQDLLVRQDSLETQGQRARLVHQVLMALLAL